jgi:hypothetical protein
MKRRAAGDRGLYWSGEWQDRIYWPLLCTIQDLTLFSYSYYEWHLLDFRKTLFEIRRSFSR